MPLLMTRKIHAIGNSLAVVLPKAWFRSLGLKAGDHIEIVIGEDLIVRPVSRPGIDGQGRVR